MQLKHYAQDRILSQMLATIRRNCKLSPDYLILVLDCHTAKQFVQYDIHFFDLYKHRVYQVEDLTRMRKRYPQSDVLYYISPCLDSIKRIIDDYKDEDEIEYDQYGFVHFAFCGACPESMMKELLKSQKLCSKVTSFYEINLDFTVVTDNAFLTKIAPYNVKIAPERQKDAKDYVYTPSPHD